MLLTKRYHQDNATIFFPRNRTFVIIFFPYFLKDGSNFNKGIRNIESSNKRKKTQPKEISGFTVNDTNGIKLLTRVRLNFTRSHEHKFRQDFRYTIDSMCKCDKEAETTLHYRLRCNLY